VRRALAALALACAHAFAQDAPPANGVLLVARPGMADPRFARTVVLVTQAQEGHTLGVVLNRPTSARHEDRPLWYGGPVLERSIVALFAADAPPAATAFHVLKGVYLTMQPRTIAALLGGESRYRLYSGFSAWAPGQLERELGERAWYVLPAEERTLFRESMEGLWEELVAKAQGARTRAGAIALQSFP